MNQIENWRQLKNKVAIVTGASSGIGYAAAKLFAQHGAKVVVAARRVDLLEKLVADIVAQGGTAAACAGDVREEEFHRQLVATALEVFGTLDVAFNNAGGMGITGPVPERSLSEWRDTIAVNLDSAFLAAKYQLPEMVKRGSGSIIFTSSFVGYSTGMPGIAAYCAAKAGVVGLTKSLAVEYGPLGIRINALLPGGTDTPMGREFANTPELMQFVQSLHAFKRIAAPEEIAQSALYLASDAASFITGSAMMVDGGASICKT